MDLTSKTDLAEHTGSYSGEAQVNMVLNEAKHTNGGQLAKIIMENVRGLAENGTSKIVDMSRFGKNTRILGLRFVDRLKLFDNDVC